MKAQGHKIVINQSKREPFTIHSGLRGVHRRLRNAWTVETSVSAQNSDKFRKIIQSQYINFKGMFLSRIKRSIESPFQEPGRNHGWHVRGRSSVHYSIPASEIQRVGGGHYQFG